MLQQTTANNVSLSGSATLDELAGAVVQAVAPLGMTASASAMVSGAAAGRPWPFHFTNWPADFLTLYKAQDYAGRDPMLRWALTSGSAISWADLDADTSVDEGRQVNEARRVWGMIDGLVVPVRTHERLLGVVSVGGPARRAFSEAERVYLIGVANVALQRAEALGGLAAPSEPSPLSLRELECVSLLRQGMTDKQIAKVLGIAGETARFHITNARRKVGARNRAHLAALPLRTHP